MSEFQDFSNLNDYPKWIYDWMAGQEISWNEIYSGIQFQRISLPTYPFAKRRCWVPTQSVNTTPKENKLQTQWLIFSDTELGFHLQDELGKDVCSFCFIGDEFKKLEENVFYIHPEKTEDYVKLMQHFTTQNNIHLKGIIYLWGLEDSRFVHLNSTILQKKFSHLPQFCLVMRELNSTSIINTQHYEMLYLMLDKKKSLCEEAKIIVREIGQYHSAENIISYENKKRCVIKLPEESVYPERINRSILLNREEVIVVILNKLSRLLDLEVREIDPEIPFQNYGLDSIIGINFVAELGEHYPDFISPMDLYRYPTVNQLTDYIIASSQPLVIQEEVPLAVDFDKSESQFFEDIAHLTDSEISQLLEDELKELENLI